MHLQNVLYFAWPVRIGLPVHVPGGCLVASCSCVLLVTDSLRKYVSGLFYSVLLKFVFLPKIIIISAELQKLEHLFSLDFHPSDRWSAESRIPITKNPLSLWGKQLNFCTVGVKFM